MVNTTYFLGGKYLTDLCFNSSFLKYDGFEILIILALNEGALRFVIFSHFWVAFLAFALCFIGICADIAVSKHEHWSSLAPLPFEVVISAGQKAKEESWDRG